MATDAKAGAASGGAAKPAAAKGGKPVPGAGVKKKKDKVVTLPKQVQKFGHGAEDRPLRQTVRMDERNTRLQEHVKAGRVPKEIENIGKSVFEHDPILQVLAEQEAVDLAEGLDIKDKDKGLAMVEEPYEVQAYTDTRKRLPAIESNLPEQFKGRVALIPSKDPVDGMTDHSDDEELFRAKRTNEQYKQYKAEYPFVPVLPSVPLANENDSQLSEMAESLLRNPGSTENRQYVTNLVKNIAYDNETGKVRDPVSAAGVEDRRLAVWWRRYTHGLPEETDSELEMAQEALRDPSTGRVLSGPWGMDSAKIPQGLLEEIANPFDLHSDQVTSQNEISLTEREAAMTSEERIINEKRRQLQDLIEKPLPIMNRPIWPLYGLLAGVDQVQQVVSGGMVASSRCMVVVGNGQGGIGFGIGKHKEAFAATKMALQHAQRDMIHISTNNGALYHDIIGKKNNVYVIVRSAPSSSTVLKAAPIIQEIFELAGIQRASAKIVGSHRRNPYVVVQALFDAFNYYSPPQADAYMRGLRAVKVTADRINPRTVYPFASRGPRHESTNDRYVKAFPRLM